jgi:predicted dehydrogenase
MSDSNDLLARRDVLSRGSLLALGLLVGGAQGLHAEELVAPAPAAADDDDGPKTPIKVGIIGLGEQGRDLLASVMHVAGVEVAYVCDTYAPMQRRARAIAPGAKAVADYHEVLNDKTVPAVFIETPSHLHKQIVLDALAAGKHVYCEAPLASSIDDARAIARAAKAVEPKQIFHSGLQQRTNPQHLHVLGFVEIGALAHIAQAKAQWHKKESWRRAAPTDARQNDLNWRLNQATSGGLLGEIGIHQVDATSWFLRALPLSVTGFGGVLVWKDGRTVPDTVQCVFEYPNGVNLAYDATLASSFEGAYELFQGTDSAVLIRDDRAWMFKESDAPQLGWEVYAYKEKVGDDTGIALVADASKLLAKGLKPGENRETDPSRGALYWAAHSFLANIRLNKPSACGPLEGFHATVAALTANEAILAGRKITFTPDMFTL